MTEIMTGSHRLYAHGFRFYFTPLAGVLFTFPSRYWFTIARQVVFSLGRWSSQIPTGFHVPHGTRVSFEETSKISPTGLSPPLVRFPTRFGYPDAL